MGLRQPRNKKHRLETGPDRYQGRQTNGISLSERDAIGSRVNRVAAILDDRYAIPGTKFRFGWDGIIGVIPGAGDFFMTLTSFYFVVEALAAYAPPSIVLRMIANIAIDAAIGSVPIFGDVGDFVWKANRKNAHLLLRYLNHPESVQFKSRIWLITGLLLVVAVFSSAIYLAWLAAFALFNWIMNSQLL